MKLASSIKFLLFTLLLFSGLTFNAYAGPVCGDGVINPEGPPTEECDDGNTDNGDGCDSTCMVEAGWTCDNQTPTIPNSVCSLTPTTTTTTTTTTTSTTTTTTSTTSTTEGTTSTTEGTTSTTEGTTSTTEGTTTTTSTTSTAGTTTTTQVPGQCSGMIVIDERNCRVEDQQVGGQCLSDAIAVCDDGRNHGQYVRCVAHVTRDAKRAGDITGREKGRIVRCAARSDIGKKPR